MRSATSLSARRAWIEICGTVSDVSGHSVALRKESVDRNRDRIGVSKLETEVALRKESVDRNPIMQCFTVVNFASLSARRAWIEIVCGPCPSVHSWSLSARRAWIEIVAMGDFADKGAVALRKESVDRNIDTQYFCVSIIVALRKESVDRNIAVSLS